VKCKSITKSHPGEISELPKIVDIPPLELQNNRIEYPKAAVGTTKGISANVSKTLSHLDLPRVINHAKGTPARRSKAATINAIINELEIAPSAELTKTGWLRKLCIAGAFMIMPMMGGIRIMAKKMMIAER